MSKKILVVDDDTDSLTLIELMLKRRGYQVISAESGSQALSKVETERPDLLILDVMMPGMDGYEVCRQLRSDAQTAHLPIIMFTAKSLVGDKVTGFQAGADDYLTKPIHPAQLVSHVEALLQRPAEDQADQVITPAYVIGVMGAKGGVGTSTLAVNLAAALYHLASASLEENEKPVKTSILDLRPGLGGVALLFGQTSQNGLANLMSMNPENLTRQVVQEQVVSLSNGLHYLPAPLQPESGHGSLLVDHVETVIGHMVMLSDHLVLDMGSMLDDANRRALERCDALVVVLEPENLCLQLATVLLDALGEKEEFPQEIYLVLNQRLETDAAYSQIEVEGWLKQKLVAVITSAPAMFRQAIEQKTPLVFLHSESETAEQLRDLGQKLLDQRVES